MDEKLLELKERLAEIRRRGHMYFNNLEYELQELEDQWRRIRSKVVNSNETTAKLLLDPLSLKRQELESVIWRIEFTLDSLARSSVSLEPGENVILAFSTILYWKEKRVDVIFYISNQRLIFEQILASKSKDKLGTLLKMALRGVDMDIKSFFFDVDITQIAEVRKESERIIVGINPNENVPFNWEITLAEIESDQWVPLLQNIKAGKIF
jgi:hypothetical protein